MRLLYLLIKVLFLGLFSLTSFAQEHEVSGIVYDQNQNPIPFANVILLDEESGAVLGTITEDSGVFLFQSVVLATYKVKVSYVGFEDYESETFSFDEDGEQPLSRKLELPAITLPESVETLGEVTLTTKRPTVERKADRIIFNVENTILSSGSTMDILKRTPGVVVTTDQIAIRNQPVTVYLNNRKVQLSNDEIQSLLRGLGGEVIKSVEVIANPPAEYDAEGGPVLNIISSKAVVAGYKGSVSARGTYAVFPKHAFSTSHFFKSEKVNLFFNYSYNPSKSTRFNDNRVTYRNEGVTTKWIQDFERKTWERSHNANLILDYNLSEKSEISVAATGILSPGIFDFNRLTTEVTPSIGDPFKILTNSTLNSDKSNIALDLNYKYALEKGSLRASIHHTNYNNESGQKLRSNYVDTQDEIFRNVRFESAQLQDIEIYTGQIDYSTTLGSVDFQVGGKTSIIDSRSKIDFPIIQDNGNSGLDEAQNDDFLYDETVYAGYVSVAKEWEKWSFKAGLRAEQTLSKGTSVVLNEINDLTYLELFPTGYVQYTSSEKHSWSFDYSRRLYRPRYADLNPFSYFINENSFITGNAQLQPSFTNTFNLNYTLNEEFSFDLYYRDNGSNISLLPFQDNESQVLRSVRQNVLESKSWGLDFTHGRSLTDWYYLYTYLSAFHEDETFLAIESGNVPFTNEVEGVYAFLGNYLTLSKDKTLTGEVSLEYFSKFLFASYIQEPTAALNVGIQKTFWNNRGILKINFNDILNNATNRLTSRYLNQDNSYLPIVETQNLQVGFTYKFGNFKLGDNNRTIENDESERLISKD